jgi:hypothetical protein
MHDRLDPGMREAGVTRASSLTEATPPLQRMRLAHEMVGVTDPGPSLRTGQEFDTGARNRAERSHCEGARASNRRARLSRTTPPCIDERSGLARDLALLLHHLVLVDNTNPGLGELYL